jgi:hypothetical protein
MKRFAYILLVPLTVGLYLFFSAYSGDECDYPSGSPAGYTGSPGDGKDCTECHNGSSTPVTGWITSDIPPSGYTPGSTYNITVTVSGSGKKGFEVSPQNSSGTQLGTLVAGSGSHLAGGGSKYVTQNSGQNSNPSTWTFQWAAPSAGTGEVTFYGAFAVSKSATKTSMLAVQENLTLPLTAVAAAIPQTILAGDSSHLDCAPAGGSGTYTYLWNSIPAGFVSTLKNPWAKPLNTTDYVVIVSDGSGTALDTVTVTVSPVGINDRAQNAEIRVFPNPTNGDFSVILSEGVAGTITVGIYNLDGKKVWQNELPGSPTPLVFEADLTSQPDGIYLVSVKDETSRRIIKIIKSTR